MKRVTTLLLAAVMLVGTAGLASAAVEFKASGHMHINFAVLDNSNVSDSDARFDADQPEDNFFAGLRFRPKLTMKADGVSAVFEVQQHQATWGSDWPVGGNPNADIRIRQAYIDYKLPGTPVSLKVGYQQLNLPGIWRNPVLEARVGGVVANIPFSDEVALTAFWARTAAANATTRNAAGAITGVTDPAHNATDLFGAMLPLNFDGVKATPYVMYGRRGVDKSTLAPLERAGDTDMLIVGGVNVAVMPMDALSVKVDAIVTSYSSDVDARDIGLGFFVASAVDYKMAWGTPGLFLWYATGADDSNEGAFSVIATDGFMPTSWGFGGENTYGYGRQIGANAPGTAGVGLQVANMSFIDSLKHTVRVAYIMGTSDEDATAVVGYTSKDTFIEVNLDSNWSIYENLAAVVELGAILPDLDAAGAPNDPALKAQLTLRFSF